MAKLEDIFAQEWDRENPAEWNKIHLYKMGDFWRAYEWSAWLMTKCPIGEAANKPMTVTAKKLKDGYIHAFVGFPATSGLPIGNLTSQLFSNVYLNVFDQFMKREMKCRYYGRYVDDAAVVSADRDWLLSMVPDVDRFLRSELGLELHKGKLEVSEVHRGVEFLGAYIKPWRTYISNHSLRRMEKKIVDFDYSKPWLVVRSVNSYLGIFQHTSSYRLRRRLFMTRPILRICTFDERILKVV